MQIEIWKLIVAIVVAIFGSTGFWTWINNRKGKKSNESKLLLGIAYQIIITRAEEYIKRGYITSDEYNELNHYLFEPYINSGGDGTAQKLMNEVRSLPTRKQAG